MSGRRLRLIHTSDVHVGGGYADDELASLKAVAKAADEEQADALLVVGDLFDHARVDVALYRDTIDLLGSLGRPCVLLCGNHDVQDDSSLHHRFADDLASSGVHYLDAPEGMSLRLFDDSLHLWGRAMTDHVPDYRPLRGAPAADNDAWFVVLGHGHYVENPDDPYDGHRSSPIHPNDISATSAHYVALGHWHRCAEVSAENVPAWYSGAPGGVAASETVNRIDLDPNTGVSITQVELPQ